MLGGIALSALAAAPYVFHLTRDYAPTGSSATARHMWTDPNALLLAVPNWSTIDLGPLLTLGLAGLWLARRRATPLEASVLGMGLAGWGIWLLSVPLAFAGISPEPDEMHYFLRYVMSLAAAFALAEAARWMSAASPRLAGGRAHLLVLSACLPLAFPVYHDPPTMDRYYAESLRPIPPKIEAYAEWIRTRTPPDAVFAAGRSAAMWIPALTGRRVLLAEAGKLLPARPGGEEGGRAHPVHVVRRGRGACGRRALRRHAPGHRRGADARVRGGQLRRPRRAALGPDGVREHGGAHRRARAGDHAPRSPSS